MVTLFPVDRMSSFPLQALADVRREFDRFFESLDHGAEAVNGARAGWVPAMDIVETDDEIRCTIEVPGIRHEDIGVSVQGNVLRVTGTKRAERREGDGDGAYRLFERRYGRFERRLTLPERVDIERIVARYEHGVLTLILPKAEAARPRQIRIEPVADVKQVEAGESR